MSIFDLRNRRKELAPLQWSTAGYAGAQATARDELSLRIAEVCQERGIHEAKLAVAMYALTADPRDETAHANSTPDDLELAEIVNSLALEQPTTRKLAARAAFESASGLHADARKRQLPVGREAAWLRQSLACLQRALKHDAGPPEYHALAARTLAMMFRHDEAFEEARLGLQGAEEPPELLHLAGTCALEAGRPDEAQTYFLRAHALVPNWESLKENIAGAQRAIRLKKEIEAEATLWPQPESAIRRIRKAYQGDRDSMAMLAREYYDGTSVLQNPALAYMWFALLARFGDHSAKERLRSDPFLWGHKSEGLECVNRWMQAHRS